jgi:uncharacterized membrane protein YdjX (TVP38/TMEM64 family)
MQGQFPNGGEFSVQVMLAAFQSWGWIGILGFMALYVGVTVVVLPTTVLTLSAGAIYGPIWGVVYAGTAAWLGAAVAFLVGRYVAHDWVQRQLAKTPIVRQPTFHAVRSAIGTGGTKMVFLTRLSPLFPFGLLNYAYALTEVPVKDYLLGSVGLLPIILTYVYWGSVAGDWVQGAGGAASTSTQWSKWALQGVGLVATIGVTVLVTRLARRELAQQTSPPTGPTRSGQ